MGVYGMLVEHWWPSGRCTPSSSGRSSTERTWGLGRAWLVRLVLARPVRAGPELSTDSLVPTRGAPATTR